MTYSKFTSQDIIFASGIQGWTKTKHKYISFLNGKYAVIAKYGNLWTPPYKARGYFAETIKEVKEAMNYLKKNGVWPDSTSLPIE